MKKNLLSLVVMLMGSTLLTGCLSDSDKNNEPVKITVTDGIYVINNGSSYNGIDGSLTVDTYDQTSIARQNVYKSVNGASLGGTPNDACVLGSKMYIVGSDENTIFVLNTKTFKEITKINTVALLGEAGATPRHIIGYGDRIYFTTYGTAGDDGSMSKGHVAVVDTVNFSKQGLFEVGVAPEGLTIGGSSDQNGQTAITLYVCNSDYGNGNGSISIINPVSGSVKEVKNAKIHNPQEIAVAGSTMYIIDWGYYDENWTQHEMGLYMLSDDSCVKLVEDATGMACLGYTILTYNYPYGADKASYTLYNIQTQYRSPFNLTGDTSKPIVSPCAISIDPNTGYVLIASRNIDKTTGYPSYSTAGFVNIYKNDGSLYKSFETGVEPHKIGFTYATKTLVTQ